MPTPLRWLVLLALLILTPFILVFQGPWWGDARAGALSAALIAGGAFFAVAFLVAVQLPALYTKYYEAKKLTGNQYQNHLRAFSQAAEKIGIKAPELLISGEGAPHAMGVGMFPGQQKVIVTRGLFETLDPDQFQAYIDYILIQAKRGDLAAMTLGAGAAYVCLLPLKIADATDSDPLRVLLTVIFGWFGAIFIQAVGVRSYCYELDQAAGAAHGVGGHLALGSALNDGSKILFKHPIERLDYSSSHLFVVNPLGGKGVAAIFATHAPTPKRVKKLQRSGTRVVGKEAVAKSKGLV